MRWLMCLILACLLGYSTQAWAGGCNLGFNRFGGGRVAVVNGFGFQQPVFVNQGFGFNRPVFVNRGFGFGQPVFINRGFNTFGGFGSPVFFGNRGFIGGRNFFIGF